MSILSASTFIQKSTGGIDPTRGRDIRAATRSWPDWIHELETGDFKGFDRWLREHGLDDTSIAGLPPFSELLGGKRDGKLDEFKARRVQGGNLVQGSDPSGPAGSPGFPVDGACQSDRCCPEIGGPCEPGGSDGSAELLPGDPGPCKGSSRFPDQDRWCWTLKRELYPGALS